MVGGVETLFKDSSGKMIDYAEKAYKTAEMRYKDGDIFRLVLSNKYILELYKYCREVGRNFATGWAKQGYDVSVKAN